MRKITVNAFVSVVRFIPIAIRARQREYFVREPLRDVPWIMEKCAVAQRAAQFIQRTSWRALISASQD